MRRGRWLVMTVLGAAACGLKSPESAPVPVVAATRGTPPADISSLPPAPDLGLAHALADTSLLRRLAADSLGDRRDMELLDELRNATPAVGDDLTAEADLAEMFDINVARYAEHGRVRYYLDFFRGAARDRMGIWLTRLPVYEPMIRAALTANGLPGDLVYLALIESGYSSTAVSRSKAVGMWQFMTGTGKLYGLKVDRWVDERRDPVKATSAAARHLADLTRMFNGSYYLAAAAYNAGAGKVSRGLKHLGSGADEDYFDEGDETADLAADSNGDDRFFHLSDTRYLRKETKDYVPKLIAAAMIAKQPEKYGFAPIPRVDRYAVDSVRVPGPTSLDVVAKAAGIDREAIATLNPQYLRGITPPTGGDWWIRVPPGDGAKAAEALASLSPADRIPGFTHTVTGKETLRSIGKRYGLSPAQLADFNPGLDPKRAVRAGTELKIPGIARLRTYAADDARAAAERARGGFHRVRPGETLITLAERYGASERQLRTWNRLGPKTKLRVGQRIRIGRTPATAARAGSGRAARSSAAGTHLVRRGETLTAVAKRYGVTVQALMEANGLRSSKGLKAGRRLTIPG